MRVEGPPWRIGVDIGGTFTDGILWNERTGQRASAKVPSTPEDLSDGLLTVVRRLLSENGIAPGDVGYLAHGTTVATNAVIEHRLASTAYVTTAGFRDVFEIARQVRPDPHDVFTVKPRPLVPRSLCFEVRERMTAQGEVLIPLDEETVRDTASRLRDAGIQAVAVCLLHSYASPGHERRVRDILREELPGVQVSASSDLVSEFREYPRACTVAINAGLMPVVASYLEGIQTRLGELGFRGELRVMQSNGGVLAFEEGRAMPVQILESGPAAGVIGAVHIGRLAGQRELISFDMGGTTAKLGLIRRGQPSMIQELEVGEQSRSRAWFSGASGYPVLVPSVDLVEIGAGGGSIAWIDSGGKLRVGPRSAGSVPGPACLGRGGTEATVTDANLVLGRLDPAGLLAGDLALDVPAAEAAIGRIAEHLALSAVQTALGIIAIADAAMVGAIRTVSIQRGYDPRDFTLVPFGGAGPLHALSLAEEMGMSRVLVQPQPGIASALGLLVTDVRHDFSATRVRPMAGLDAEELERSFGDLEARGRDALRREGIPEARQTLRRFVEMRYVGQSYQLVVPLPGGAIDQAHLRGVAADFHALHEMVNGHSEPSEPLEMVNQRVSAVGRIEKPQAMRGWRDAQRGDLSLGGRRRVCYGSEGFVESAVHWRPSLLPGMTITGPAVIEEHDSTTLVRPSWSASVTDSFDLLITRPTAALPEAEPMSAVHAG